MGRKIQNPASGIFNKAVCAICIALVSASCSLEGDIKSLRPKPVPEPDPVLSAPGLPIVISGDGMITVRWAAVEEALSYEVYINDTGDEPPDAPNAVVYSTVAVFDNLVNKTVYYVWVKAKDVTRSSDFSPRARGIPWPANEKPAAPGELTIIPGINQLTVIWEECGGASSYEVYISTTPATPLSSAVTTDKTNAVIRELENDVIYYLWVRAVNSAGESDYSPRAVGTPRVPTTAPAAPAMPVLIAGSRELSVSWQAVELAASYEVWFGTADNSGASEKFGSDVVDTETVITGLTNETTYYVWIKAKNIIGASGFSLPASAKPSAFAVLPETPEMPEVTPGSRALNVSWQAVEGALFYELWIGETDNPANAEKHGEDISGTSVTLNNLDNDTTYYIWIKAKNDIGESGLSPMASGTPSAFAAIPSAPQNAPMVSAGSGQLTVSWQEAEGATAYEVWIGTANNPATATKRGDDVSGLSAVITGLTNGTTYYVWIKAKNSVGTSGFSPTASGTPSAFNVTPQAPAAPVVSIGSAQITVTWAAVEGAAAYEIWLGTSNNSASAAKNGADESASLSRTISGLTNGTTYYIWLKAKNNTGTSGFSPVATGKPIANAATVTLAAGNEQISATWAVIAGADQYEVFYGTGANPPQTALQTVTAPSTTITGLVNGTSYNVWVRGRNSTGTGAMSGPANARPIGGMGTVALVSGDGQLTANWPVVAGADQYEVYYNTTAMIPASPAQTVTATTATLSGLTNGTMYYVFIIPKNANGAGATSTVGGTPMATPGNLTVSAASQQITVSWASVPGATTYEVYYSATSTIPTSPSFTVTELSRTVTGLSNGTTYYFWVKAVNDNGTSGASPMASGTPSVFNVTPQAPAAPVVSIGNGQIAVTWAAVEGALAYEIWLGTTDDSADAAKNGADESASLSRTISGLTNGTAYYIWLKAKNNAGASGFSPVAIGRPVGNAAVPTLAAGNEQLFVTWAAIAGADQYEVFYGTGPNPPQTALQTLTAPSTTITGLVNGTSYNVWIRGKNSTGTGAMSGPASARPVGNMGAVTLASGNNQLTVNWPAVAGADQYEVYYSTTATIPASPAQTVNAPATTATISGLTNGTTYYVWVKPINANGAGTVSAAASGMPMATPGSLTVSAANQQITVSWASVPGANSYEIYHSTGTTLPASPSFTVTGLSRAITGLSNGTTYYFWVKAVNANGTSGASPMASGKPVGNMGTVTVSVGGSGQITANWSAVAGADQYEVYYGTTNTMPGTPSQTVTTTTATISSLTNGTTCYVWVKPKNANGVGGTSAAASGVPMATPGSLTVSAEDQQITISWSAVPGAASYEVYYSTTVTIPALPADTVTDNEKEFTGLSNGTTYYFWVKAVNANGTSGASPVASGKPVGNMGTVTVTSGNGQLTANWPVVAGAEEYEVYFSTTTTMPASPAQTVTTTTATISGLTNGTTYYVWVKPKNANGFGGTSAAVSGVPMAYTVTYDINGGTGTTPAAQTVTVGASVTLPGGSGFSMANLTFGGWNTNAAGTGTNYSAGSSYTPTGNITLYAQWQATVTYDINGGTGTTPAAQTVNAGDSITLPDDTGFSRGGYAFGGWNANTSGTGTNYDAGSSYTVTGNITLYAKWNPIYIVTFDKNGGDTEANPRTKTVTYPATTVGSLPEPPARASRAFNGWNTRENGTGTLFTAATTVTGNITVYAQWSSVEMVWVPGGSFEMGKNLGTGGGNDVTPVHAVTLTSGFYIGKYEVTQAQYQAVMGTNPGSGYGVGDNYPVYYVSWYAALVFCNRLSIAEGLTPAYRINGSTDPAAWGSVPTVGYNSTWDAVTIVGGSTGYRLPTEAQWEYAAKGGNGSPGNYTYSGSNNPDEVAWYLGNNDPSGSKPVGTKQPNGLGIYDMSGNVLEWCWDTDPTGVSPGAYRVVRGGGWPYSSEEVRSVYRYIGGSWGRDGTRGFRLTRP